MANLSRGKSVVKRGTVTPELMSVLCMWWASADPAALLPARTWDKEDICTHLWLAIPDNLLMLYQHTCASIQLLPAPYKLQLKHKCGSANNCHLCPQLQPVHTTAICAYNWHLYTQLPPVPTTATCAHNCHLYTQLSPIHITATCTYNCHLCLPLQHHSSIFTCVNISAVSCCELCTSTVTVSPAVLLNTEHSSP